MTPCMAAGIASTIRTDSMLKPPNLVPTDTSSGLPTAWKCPACSEPFDLSRYHGTTQEKRGAMIVAYYKHFKDRHSYEDASQTAVR